MAESISYTIHHRVVNGVELVEKVTRDNDIITITLTRCFKQPSNLINGVLKAAASFIKLPVLVNMQVCRDYYFHISCNKYSAGIRIQK